MPLVCAQEGLYVRVEIFHVVVFVSSWVLAIIFILGLLRPFMAHTKVGAACVHSRAAIAVLGSFLELCEGGSLVRKARGLPPLPLRLSRPSAALPRAGSLQPPAPYPPALAQQRETERIAECLSQLPPDVDVEVGGRPLCPR